jgi:enoyl-CoA hydratase/carnithine racemase
MSEARQIVTSERVGQVAVLTIDNPPVNALSPAVWEGLDRLVARGAADPAAEAIVVIGAGTTFIAGADIKVFETLKTREDSLARSAADSRSRRPVTSASRRKMRRSVSRKCCSASSRARAARSVSRACAVPNSR